MEKKRKQKPKQHGGYKIIWLCGIIWSELLLEGEGVFDVPNMVLIG